ncbi:hypothetical protein TUM12370_34010 [Salmonella enterica subsp. enterica serovar Choleraesuis]|nr:hypothetical protein TUM12370_34010 [Salmonella enterica subsp. enterica serovar Choleraesuis]
MKDSDMDVSNTFSGNTPYNTDKNEQRTRIIGRQILIASECAYFKMGLRALLVEKLLQHNYEVVFSDFSINAYSVKMLVSSNVFRSTLIISDPKSTYHKYIMNFYNYQVMEAPETRNVNKLLKHFFWPEISEPENKKISYLDNNENTVITMLMKALTPREICKIANIDEKKVSYYKRRAMKKLGVNTTQDLYRKYSGVY